MSTDSKIRIVIDAEGKEAEAEIKNFAKQLQNAGKKGESSFKKITSSAKACYDRLVPTTGLATKLGAALGAYQLSKVAGGFLNVASSMEQYETTLGTVLRSNEKAQESMKWITDFAASTPFEIPGLVEATTRLEAYGLSSQQYLQTLGDTAASMGKPIMAAVEMIADASQGEFERMKEFGLRASDLAAAAGFRTVSEMTSTRENLILGTETLMSLLESRYSGGMKRLSNTWTGMISNMKDLWFQFQKGVMDAGIFQYLSAWVDTLKTKLEEMKATGAWEVWAKKISDNFIWAFEVILKGIARVIDGWKMLWQTIKLGVATSMKYVSTFMDQIVRFAQQIPFIGDSPVFVEMREAVQTSITYWGQMADESGRALDVLGGAENLYKRLIPLLDTVHKKAAQMGKAGSDSAATFSGGWSAAESTVEDAAVTAMDRILEAEEQTADKRIRIAEDLADRRIDAERYAADTIGSYSSAGSYSTGTSSGYYTGLPVGYAGGYWESTLLPGQTFATKSALEAAKNELIRSQEELARANEDATREIVRQEEERARAIEAATRELQREAEARARENDRLADSLGGQYGSVVDWLADLSTGSQAPVQSMESWTTRYDELLTAAWDAEEGVTGFLSYAQNFLDFQRQFSGGMNYAGIYNQVVRDVQALEGFYGDLATLADLGFGTTAYEVGLLKAALDKVGLSADDLKAKAEGASGKTAGLAGTLQGTETPFDNVTGALEGFSANALEAVTDVEGFFAGLADSLGITYSGGNLPTAVSALTPTTYEQPSAEDQFTKLLPSTGWPGGYRYEPTGENIIAQLDVGLWYARGQYWVPRYDAYNREAWYAPGTGETVVNDFAGGPFLDQGGIVSGPDSGYQVTMHGTEAVIQLRNGPVPVTINPEVIGNAVAQKIAPMLLDGGNDIHVHLHLDGREIVRTVVRKANDRDPELVAAFRRLSQGA